jgi:hypothetical protein
MARRSNLTKEKAARILVGLRAGKTPRLLWTTADSIKSYCADHPDYAREALPLIEANNKAALRRKGDSLRTTTHCRAGLHLMVGDNVFLDGTHGRRRCLACRRVTSAFAPLMTVEAAEKIKNALEGGASLAQVTIGRPVGGGKRNPGLIVASFKIVKRYRRENPDFDRFVIAAIADSESVGQKVRYQRKRSAAKREEVNDYHAIRAMLPASFPDKDDVVSAIFEDLLTGALKRDDVRDRIQTYAAAHNRMFPTKYAKFGNAKLLSLDEVMYDDGTATRGDTVSRGLWD